MPGDARWDAKSALERVRNNFVGGAAPAQWLAPGERRLLLRDVPWLRSYVTQLRRHRRGGGRRDDGYAPTGHGCGHRAWKATCADAFAAFLPPGAGTVLFLDDVEGAGRQAGRLRTCAAVEDRCARRLIPNPSGDICRRAVAQGAEAYQGTLEAALRGVWARERLDGVYVDTCHGSVAKLQSQLELALPLLRRGGALAATLTVRDSVGGSLHSRALAMLAWLETQGCRLPPLRQAVRTAPNGRVVTLLARRR